MDIIDTKKYNLIYIQVMILTDISGIIQTHTTDLICLMIQTDIFNDSDTISLRFHFDKQIEKFARKECLQEPKAIW